jgi:chromosome segregation ATPase
MLEKYCEGLAEAIDEFEHEARRCRDKIQRQGGESHRLARELRSLKRNCDFNRDELERARRRLTELTAPRGPRGETRDATS